MSFGEIAFPFININFNFTICSVRFPPLKVRARGMHVFFGIVERMMLPIQWSVYSLPIPVLYPEFSSVPGMATFW